MLPYASFCNFYRYYRPGTLLGMSWDLFESPSTPNFWHKRRSCSWSLSPLVPICWTMLPFATFIDTRGLEHCWESHVTFWESHGTFSGKSFQPNFLARAPALQSVAFSSHICFTLLPFATFIDSGDLEYWWKKFWDILRKVVPPQFFGTSAGVAVSRL